jgi:long-chain acyl-CoA synthetase
MNTLAQVNKEFEYHEEIELLFVILDVWTPEDGMLTHTIAMKIKRNQVEKHYSELCTEYRSSKKSFSWAAPQLYPLSVS